MVTSIRQDEESPDLAGGQDRSFIAPIASMLGVCLAAEWGAASGHGLLVLGARVLTAAALAPKRTALGGWIIGRAAAGYVIADRLFAYLGLHIDRLPPTRARLQSCSAP